MNDLLFDDLYQPRVVPVADLPAVPPHASGSHSSYTGARAVVECFAERQAEILQLLAGGPKSRQELEGLTRYKINSICSVVGVLLKRGLIERTGDYDTFTDSKGRVTRRERVRVKR